MHLGGGGGLGGGGLGGGGGLQAAHRVLLAVDIQQDQTGATASKPATDANEILSANFIAVTGISNRWQLGSPQRIPGGWWRTWRRRRTAGSEINGLMRHLETIQ